MPHIRFVKGSPEAHSHMKSLREKRKGHKAEPVCDSSKPCPEPEPEPIVTEEIKPFKKPRRPRVKKEKIQEIIKDAVEKYFA